MEELPIENQETLYNYKKALDISSIVTKADLTGRITYVNKKFCDMSGYSQEELLGQNHNIVRHPDQPSSSFTDLWKTIKDKKVWNGILQNKHKDGSSYYVSSTIIPLLNKEGNTIEYISIRRDITELHLLKNNLEERVAKEVEKNKKKDEELINNLHLILDSTPNPIIALDHDNKVKFVNKPFLRLVRKKKESMLEVECNFSDLLNKDSDYISCEDNFVLNEANKISITTSHGRNIFNLYYKEIILNNDKSLRMYTLNNITINEYQKLKINHYNQQLQEYYMRHKTSKVVEHQKNKQEPTKIEDGLIKEQGNKETRELNNAEKTLLHRKHNYHAVSSKEYSQELDEYILTEIQELDEIETEISNMISEYQDKKPNSMSQVVTRLLKYSSVLNNLIEFKELAFSMSSLSDLLDKQDLSVLDETTYKKMLLFLENITLDLSSWRRIVFVEQSANDIHYMTSSLFSSILQLELIFNTDKQIEGEDDFELF